MIPDFQKAAIKATETLIKYGVHSAPVDPLPILKQIPGVLVLSFSEISNEIDIKRNNLVTIFGLENQDAVTSVQIDNGSLRYIVAYNQQLSLYILQRSLARELGHIILEHNESIPEDVRVMEAKCFSKHLLCPRALIHAIQEKGASLTVEAVGCITGCYGRCQALIRKLPGVNVPAELNRKVHEQFSDYIDNFLRYQSFLVQKDSSPLAEFGDYMTGYEE